MTKTQTNPCIGIIAAIGGAASLLTAYFQPAVFTSVLAASGGALAGASVIAEKKREHENVISEAARVTTAFSQLYDLNKGIVSVEQLAYIAHVAPERIKEFLDRLSEQQKGQLITTEKGVVYSFPHPAHVLTELTNNAQNWATSQHNELLEQVNILQQRLTMLTIQQTAARSQPSGLLPQQELNNNKDTEYRIDPWNKLL